MTAVPGIAKSLMLPAVATAADDDDDDVITSARIISITDNSCSGRNIPSN